MFYQRDIKMKNPKYFFNKMSFIYWQWKQIEQEQMS